MATCPATAPPAFACPRRPPRHERTWRTTIRTGLRASLRWAAGTVAALGGMAAFFVGAQVIEQYLWPSISTGMRHFVLTVQAAMVTGLAALAVYVVMRRQQRRLSDTARRLATLLETCRSDPSAAKSFDNPYLVHCRDLMNCPHDDCPMHASPGRRCWQEMALRRRGGDPRAPVVGIADCLECEVYRRSCPTELVALGEAFNNLMFLLEEEANQVSIMRAQLVERDKMAAIGQLAAGIAHEVGNPLSSISSVVQMLQRAGPGKLPAEDLDLIQKHIQRISATVRQLGGLARPDTHTWQRVDPALVLEEVVKLVRFDRRAEKMHIEYDCAGPLPLTYAVGTQLEQVFLNLAMNGLDAMTEGGTLTLRAKCLRRTIVVEVQDTGCGMDPRWGRRAFEPFFTTKEPGHGTGLGLAVSYGIVQKHGGTIGFESGVGQGTLFTVTLPVLDKPPEPEHGAQHRTAGGR